MKLSDMFATLAENAKLYEKRVSEWQDDLSSRGDEAMSGAKKWQETALQQQEEMNKQIRSYFDDAGENVRGQWQQMQDAWEEQFEKMRAKGEEMREAAGKLQGQDMSKWTEAYAAQMVGFAQRMQDEAAKAVASASDVQKKATSAARKKT